MQQTELGIDESADVPPKQVPEVPAEGFGVRSARGGIIISVIQIVGSIINFGAQIALSWLLLPEDFGVVAVAVSISSMIGAFRDGGAPLILIQRQNEFDRIAGSVFWMTLAGSTFCGLITAGAAPFMAHAKHNPVLLPVLLLTALRFPLGALGTVSFTRLMVDLRWGVVGMITLLIPLVTGVTSVVMAYFHFGVYALIIPPILADVSRGFVSWVLSGKHVRLRPDMALMSGIVISSVWIMLSNLMLSVRGTADYLTVSFTRSESETGLYYYGFVMALAFARLALGAAPSVLQPVFSKVKHDSARHADIMIRAVHMFAAIGVIAIVMQGAMTWPIFRLLLNPKWLPAAPIFCIITLQILSCFLNNMFSSALGAHGYYKQYFTYLILFTPFSVLLYIAGVKLAGPIGVAWANVVVGCLDFLLFSVIALRLLKVAWKPTILPLWRPLAAAVPTALLGYVLHYALPTTKIADILCILITGIVGSLTYLLILWVVWREVVVAAWTRVAAALGARKR